jgi:hypothetical protein
LQSTHTLVYLAHHQSIQSLVYRTSTT